MLVEVDASAWCGKRHKTARKGHQTSQCAGARFARACARTLSLARAHARLLGASKAKVGSSFTALVRGKDDAMATREDSSESEAMKATRAMMKTMYECKLGSPPIVARTASREEASRETRAYAARALELERAGSFESCELEGKCNRVELVWKYVQAHREPFVAGAIAEDERDTRRDFDAILLDLSAAFERSRGSDGATSPKRWCPPSTFERRTVKYWVDPRDAIPVQLAILKHLPILEFSGGEDAEPRAEDDEDQDRSLITSVYLDNPQFDVYRTRLAREQGATLARCRWYGGSARSDDVFIERKTHHESWSAQKSVKERCSMRREDAVVLLQGTPPKALSMSKKNLTLAREVLAQEIKRRGVKPTLLTQYRRTAFQRSDGNQLRVSFDTDLRWRDVRGEGSGVLSNAAFKGGEPAAFRFAILEVKLATEDAKSPEWIENIISSFNVTQVYKFSKFLHGCAMLFYPNEALPKLPHWYGADANECVVDVPIESSRGDAERPLDHDGTVHDIERTESASSFTELMRAAVATLRFRRNEQKRVNRLGVGNADVEQAPAMRFTQRHVPVKVEPKTFFANERTLLQWLSMSILLLFLALGLLAIESSGSNAIPFGGSNARASATTLGSPFAGAICGIIIAPISILFMLYALWTYIVRARRIARREASTRYDDVFGPVALVVILVLVAVSAVALSVASIDWQSVRYARAVS